MRGSLPSARRSASANGLAQVPRLLAGRHLPPGRDAAGRCRAGRNRSATQPIRNGAAQAGQGRSPATHHAPQRAAATLSELARRAGWKSGAVLQVREKDALIQEVRIGEVCQVSLMGNVQISTQAVQALCEADVPICYFSMGGWFYGITIGLNEKNVFLRRSQFRFAEQDYFARSLSRRLVTGKIRNQCALLQRNHVEPGRNTLVGLKEMAERAEGADSLEELLGIEGNAARLYFRRVRRDDQDGRGRAPGRVRF